MKDIICFFEPFLENLDPSLFQNIILGILAIFIPFAIVFLTNLLNDKKEKKSEFEKMVLNDEVLGTQKVFWLSVFGIVFFAFFSGEDISSFRKIISIILLIILIFFFWQPFKKILRFSEGYKSEFEIAFLNSLNFSKILTFRNQAKAEKMVRAWASFWSEQSKYNEVDFTNIFISHIDDAINHKRFELAIKLSQTYINNIEKRDRLLIGYDIFPKIFKWNEFFWNEKKLWLKNYDIKKKIQSFISEKYFPTFRNWMLKLYKKTTSKRDRFWHWDYFGTEFFQVIIKTLLKDANESSSLFSLFKEYIEETEKKLEKIIDEQEKDSYWDYITQLFLSFCPTFFNNIDSAPSNYRIWEYHFPNEWKITMTNKDINISYIFLNEFVSWSRNKVFKKENEANFNCVINGIFPNVYSSLFTAFLILYFSNNNIKYALETEPNFHIFNSAIFSSVPIEESEEDRIKRHTEMRKNKDISQKEETVQVILQFFSNWEPLVISKDDLKEDEFKNWEGYTEEQKKLMQKKNRKGKFEKIKIEIESEEIKKICENSEKKELYRKDFLELIELLISKL